MISIPYKTLVKCTSVILLSEVVYVAIRKIYSRFVNKSAYRERESLTSCINRYYGRESNATFNQVLFFPDPGISCQKEQMGRVCRDANCKAIHKGTSLGNVLKIISFARKRIDVCVYLITSTVLGDLLVKCHKEGIIVRVITDDRNSGERGEVSSAQVGKFRAAGISVHVYAASFWMHHKFVILDGEVLITGSLNWTNQAALGNFENLVITSESQLVLPYIKEFEDLYKKLEPTKSAV